MWLIKFTNGWAADITQRTFLVTRVSLEQARYRKQQNCDVFVRRCLVYKVTKLLYPVSVPPVSVMSVHRFTGFTANNKLIKHSDDRQTNQT